MRQKPLSHPRGVGVYCRAAPVRPHILRAAHVSFAAIMVESADGRVQPISQLRKQAARAREGGATSIWLWALHGPAAANDGKAAAARLCEPLSALDADGVILDIEAAHKGKPLACRELVSHCLDRLTERTHVGVTSFPIAASHPTLPWAEMLVGWGSPQLYQSAGSREVSRRALSEWRAWHGYQDGRRAVLPSLAAYETQSPGDGPDQLAGDLERVCLDDTGAVDVPGIVVWSEPQLSLAEAVTVGVFAERAGW